jgi:hypothetical protein
MVHVPITALPLAAFPQVWGWNIPSGTSSAPAGPGSQSGYSGAPAQAAQAFDPLSQSFKGKLDKPLPLATNYDKLARELGKRDPQLLAIIAPFKGVPGVTVTVTQVQMATPNGPALGTTLRLSLAPKNAPAVAAPKGAPATGGPSPEVPVTGMNLGFTFASLGVSIVIDRALAKHEVSPYKRGALIVGGYALAGRLLTGNWAVGKSAFKGWAQFNFFTTVTAGVLEGFGINDPAAVAYGSAGITGGTMLAHHLMSRGGGTVALKGVQTAASSRGLTAAAPKLAGKALWVLQVIDIGGGIAEEIVYDTYDDRTAIKLGFERQEMRDRMPTGLKWTTNFSFVRWPMRWFGGADEAADEKTRQYIAQELAPQMNSVADAAEAQMLISAAKAVTEAKLKMIDPCLSEVAYRMAYEDAGEPYPFKTKIQCTTFLSEELTEARKAGMRRVGILPPTGRETGMPIEWTNSWGNDPWGQDDEHLRYQFWEYLARGTEIYFHPDLQIGDYRTFQNAYGMNKLVSGVDEAKPWNAIVDFVNEKGRITDHRKFGAYLKEPVRERCDQVASNLGDDLLTLADLSFKPDGSFDMEKYTQLVASYYQTPELKEGMQEFYDLLVIDSVHGGESRGQEIARALNAKGEVVDEDALVLFLMKALSERRNNKEEELRAVVKLSGLNPDSFMTHSAATGSVEFHSDLLTPDIEKSILEKGGDEMALKIFAFPDQYDALYHSLNSPLSEEYVASYVRGEIDPQTGLRRPVPNPSATPVSQIFQVSPTGDLDLTNKNKTFL